MSKKLTEQKIDQLIKDLLKEKQTTEFPGDYEKFQDFPFIKSDRETKTKDTTAPVFIALNTLKSIKKPNQALNNKDIEYLVDNPSEIEFEHIQAARQLIKSFKAGFKDTKRRSKDYHGKNNWDKAKKIYIAAIASLSEIEVAYADYISQQAAGQAPETTVVGDEITTRRAEMGSSPGTAPFPPQQLAIIRKAFPSGSEDDLAARLGKLSEISQRFYKASTGDETAVEEIKKASLSETLNNVLLMDLFAMIVKDMDSGAGAYFFEYFMALMYEGLVTGKETTDANKMAATDFVTKGGKRGSAKFKTAKAGLSQTTAGFPLNEEVTYVVALKREDESQFGKENEIGVANPVRIVGVDIYSFPVKRTGSQTFELDGDEDEGKEVNLKPAIKSKNYKGTVRLVATPTSTFANLMDDAFSEVGDTIKNAYDQLKLMAASLNTAKRSTKEYISSGDMTVGNKALDNIKTSETSFANIVTALSGENEYGKIDPTTGRIQEESKQQTLNDLIAETMRDIKKKRKK